jgi:hypothetical protein
MNTKRTRYGIDKANNPESSTYNPTNFNNNGTRKAWSSVVKGTEPETMKTTIAANIKDTNLPTWDVIQLKIQENVEASTNKLRTEFQQANKATNQRINIIDQKIKEYSDRVDTKLDNISVQCTANTTTSTSIGNAVNRLEMMFTRFFGTDKENEDSFSQMTSIGTPDKMDYQKSRDKLELQRQLSYSPNITYTPQGENCSGAAAKMKKIIVSNTVNNCSTIYDPIVDNQHQRRINAKKIKSSAQLQGTISLQQS